MAGRTKSKKPRGRPPIQSEGEEYSRWLTLVPEEKRKIVAKVLRDHPVKEYMDLVTLSQHLVAEILLGNLTPSIAKEVRLWVELMFTIMATENSAYGTPANAYSDIITALVAVKREAPKLEAAYSVIDTVPVMAKEETG